MSSPKRSLSSIGEHITVELMESVVQCWAKIYQDTIEGDLEKDVQGKGRFKGLNLMKREDGIFIVKGRMGSLNELSYSEDVLLPKGHRFARL